MQNGDSSVVRGALCLVGLVVVVALTGCGRPAATSSVPGKGSSAATTTANATTAPIFSDQWVEVTLLNGDAYFGRIRDYGTDSALLWDVYYPSARGAAKDTILSKMGQELHKPLSMMVIPRHSLQSWQDLSDKSKILEAIRASGDKGATPPSDTSVKSAKTVSVFLQDGRVLFGAVRDSGAWTGIENGYFLSRKDPKSKPDAPIRSLNDLQLVPQADPQLGRGATLWVERDAVLFYEPLAGDSPVVTAIAAQAKK